MDYKNRNPILALFVLLPFLSGCLGEVLVKLKDENAVNGGIGGSFTVTAPSSSILSGDVMQFSASDGTAPYTGLPLGVGSFVNPALEYTAARSQGPLNHIISIQDNASLLTPANISIIGFQKSFSMDRPKSFDDQNYPMAMGKTASGDIYVSSVIGDAPGWERWTTWKSTDTGLNWSVVDEFIEFEEGETHPMGMINKGNDIYVCGYGWLSGGSINSEWFVRKSVDAGATWTISDRFNQETGNNVCYDVDVHIPSGNIYTVGYAFVTGPGNSGFIRESTDDGATWTTIGNIPAVRYFVSTMVSPAGVVWAVGRNDATSVVELYKGTFAGTWSWSGPHDMGVGTFQVVGYQHGGDLEIVSETEAYFAGQSGTNWIIKKTTDGGLNWTTVYTGGANTEGINIDRLSSGELVSVGSFTSSPTRAFKVVRSTDNGATWTETYSNNTTSRRGNHLIEANDGSVLVMGVEQDLHDQMLLIRSTDQGATWSDRAQLNYLHNFWSYVEGYDEDAFGNIFTAGWVSKTDTNLNDTWAIMKSSDNGATWTQSDIITDPVDDYYSMKVEAANGNYVYALGTRGNNLILRQSTDNGGSWATVDSSLPAGTTSTRNALMTVDTTGIVYYTATFNNGVVDPPIRKATANGTIFTDIEVFPIKAGSTTFKPYALKALDDGSVWLGGTERDAGVTTTIVYYRSIDGGVTWNEVFSKVGSDNYMKILKASNGDIYMKNGGFISRTSDNGATWNDVYSQELGAAQDFSLDNNNRLFIKRNDQIFAYSSHSSSWFVTWDINDVSSISSHYPNLFIECSFSPYGVCLNVIEEQSIQGSANLLWPLRNP